MNSRKDTHSTSSARAYLDSLILHGVKLGLNNMRHLMALAENPFLNYPVVHVGGTNGKGSVLAFLASILSVAGYRTARFTSPHLLRLNERFLDNGTPISDAALDEHIEWFRRAAAAMDPPPTFFELNAAIAFQWFSRIRPDIALVEGGMGGRFDATNIVMPEVSAIVNIAYDHMQYLGNTLEAIAFEKAGILKKDVPAVIGDVAPGPLDVIQKQANHVGAPLYRLGSEYHVQGHGTPWRPLLQYEGRTFVFADAPLGLAGRHQIINAGVAVALAELLSSKFGGIQLEAVLQGLSQARWPGRLECILKSPPVFMDAAHNPAGCRALADCFAECVTVFAVSSDKEASSMLDALAPISRPLILTEYHGARSMPLKELCQAVGNHPHCAIPALSEALDIGLSEARENRPLLITGSIYALGEARRILTETRGAAEVMF